MQQQLARLPWLALCACLLWPAMASEAQVSNQTDLVLAQYLRQDCGSGDANPSIALDRVVELGDRVVPALLTVLRQGPGAEIRNQFQQQTTVDFRRLTETIRSGVLEGLEPEVVEAAKGLTLEQYLTTRLGGLVAGYQERALNALERLNTTAAVAGLRALSNEASLDEPLRQWIGESLDRMQDR